MRIPRIIQKIKDKYDHRTGTYAHLFAAYKGDEVVSLDFETTSLDINEAEIVSIGAVKIKGKKLLNSERLDIKLKPPASLTSNSIKVHKIREADLAQGLDVETAINQLLDFIANRPLLGYNIRYDVRILDKYLLAYHGFVLPNKLIELGQVYKSTVHNTHVDADIDLSFDTLSQRLNIPIIERHSAIGDALTVALMYVRLRYGERPSTH